MHWMLYIYLEATPRPLFALIESLIVYLFIFSFPSKKFTQYFGNETTLISFQTMLTKNKCEKKKKKCSESSAWKMYDATNFARFMVFMGNGKANTNHHRWRIDVETWRMYQFGKRRCRLYICVQRFYTKLLSLCENVSAHIECFREGRKSMCYSGDGWRANDWTCVSGYT